MAHWNYRVVRRTYVSKLDQCSESLYQIHEAHYDNEGDTKPSSITTDPVDPHGETKAELRSSIVRMLAALDKPALDYETREEIS